MASEAERSLETQLKWASLPALVLEHRFHPDRRFRLDFAWPDRLLAVEIDGGSWVGGRHSTGLGFERDCVKYSEAAVLGWRIIRVTPRMVDDGRALDLISRGLA